MNVNRRSLILGAGIAAAVPKLVLADSLIDLPGNPLTAHGLSAAARWASQSFRDFPGCRLVYSNGYKTGWYQWSTMKRTQGGECYAIAIETRTTDEGGHSYITTTPVDGAGFAANWERGVQTAFSRWRDLSEQTEF